MRGSAAGRGCCALDMAEGTASVGSASGADKATAATPEVLEPRVYDRAGGGGGCAIRPPHGEAWSGVDTPCHCCERAPKSWDLWGR